jgi:predicted metal-dependent enzyme (double-stranded beta helix superfamily)
VVVVGAQSNRKPEVVMDQAIHAAGGSGELSGAELIAVARGFAAAPDRWERLVRHDPDRRVYEELRRDAELSVWLICWMDDHDTGFHDHDLSSGAVAVVSGQVTEERLVLGGPPTTRTFAAGQAFGFGAADIHRVRHAGTAPAVTIHAYSPPLWRMGAYEVLPRGELRRHALSYADELRPHTVEARA